MAIILFAASNGALGSELWVTDGSGSGTSMLVDIRPGATGSTPGKFFAMGNGKVLFQANDGVHGNEPWISDGTAAGTSMLANLNPGGVFSNSDPAAFTAIGGGKVLFQATDGAAHGHELWITDGTAAGTSQVIDIRPGGFGSYGGPIQPLGNGLSVFSADDGVHGRELFVTDGTGAGTSLLKDIEPGAGSPFANQFIPLGDGRMVFEASTSAGQELWITDGTTGGTSQVLDIGGLGNNGAPEFITNIGGGQVLFRANDGTVGVELWISDGSAAGTSMVKNINTGAGNAGSGAQYFTPLGNGTTVFIANDGSHGLELWATDRTAVGTTMVADINAGTGGSVPRKLKAIGGGRALFEANDGTHGIELWVTDGSAAGTSMLLDINPGAGSGKPAYLSYFTPTGTGQFLFDADDGVNGLELWTTDGTTAGTSLVSDIAPGATAGSPTGFTLDLPCFAAGTRILTAEGEIPVEDLRPGMRVPTGSGRLRAIVWVGRTVVDLARHAEPVRAAPITVLANAFAPGVPGRALRLSPDHAVLAGGGLIPIRLLVNGATILRAAAARMVRYFHVELDGHDILLAEGLPAESYLDTGNRAIFAGVMGARPLHPDLSARSWDGASCRPLLLGGAAVAAAHGLLR